jgi:hypothetical protein
MLSDIFSPGAKERPAFRFYRSAKVMLGVMPRNALRRLFGVQFHYPVKLYCFTPLTDSLCSSAAHPCAGWGNLTGLRLKLLCPENKKTSALRRRLNLEDASALMHIK